MKKALFAFAVNLLFVSLFFCSNLFCTEFNISAGAGGNFGGFLTRYKANDKTGEGKMIQNLEQINYGGHVFIDAFYGELTIIFQNGSGSYNEIMSINGVLAPRNGDSWETMLGFCLLGKYPFTHSKKLSYFPLLGIEYQFALSQKRRPDGGLIYDRTNGIQETDKNGNALDISSWNSFWINLGAGMDYNFTRTSFMRVELLYGFRLMTSYERDGLAQTKEIMEKKNLNLGGLTSGPSLRIGLGYKFI